MLFAKVDMKSWISFLFLFIAASFAQATPAGLAEVMSIYRDRQSGQEILVKGYGIVVEINLVMPDGHFERQYLIQTVSHVSQGGYENLHLSEPMPGDGEAHPVPKLLINIAKDEQNHRIFGHHSNVALEPEFKDVLKGEVPQPLIGSSFFESFRDRDLLILQTDHLPGKKIPAAVSLTYAQGNPKTPQSVKYRSLQLEDDWQRSRYEGGWTIVCPKVFPACTAEQKIEFKDLPRGIFAQRLLKDGSARAEYDRWIPFATNPGMSGLPVFQTDAAGQTTGVLGLISGSSPQTRDAWLSGFDPQNLFERWISAVSSFQAQGKDYKVYGYGDFIWMMDQFSLNRVGKNLEGFTFQESGFLSSQSSSAPFRCQHGSGFRIDNGSGFRIDNGDLICAGNFYHGQSFVTQLPGQKPRLTAFMMMDHPQMTLFFPPTATGFGYYFLQNNLDVYQKAYRVPPSNAMKFKVLSMKEDGSPSFFLTENEFKGFAKTIYNFVPSTQSWSADLEMTLLDKTLPQKFEMSEGRGRLVLKPLFERGLLVSVKVRIESPDLGIIEKVIEYQNLKLENSIAQLQQKVRISGGEGLLNLSGILMHNLDAVNSPDLDLELNQSKPKGDPSALVFRPSVGDRELKTVFSLSLGARIYYFTVRR